MSIGLQVNHQKAKPMTRNTGDKRVSQNDEGLGREFNKLFKEASSREASIRSTQDKDLSSEENANVTFIGFLAKLQSLLAKQGIELNLERKNGTPLDTLGEIVEQLPENLQIELKEILEGGLLQTSDMRDWLKHGSDAISGIALALKFIQENQQVGNTKSVHQGESQRDSRSPFSATMVKQMQQTRETDLLKEVKPIHRLFLDSTKNLSFISPENKGAKNGSGEHGKTPTIFDAKSMLPMGQAVGMTTGFMPKVQHYLLHVSPDEAASTAFLNQLKEIMSRSRFAVLPNGPTQLTIKLFPENLGNMTVQLIQQNGEMIAKIVTSTGSAKELVEGQLHQLRNAFISQNIQVDRIEVHESLQHWLSSEEHQEDAQQQKEQETEEAEPTKENVSEVSFNELLEDLTTYFKT